MVENIPVYSITHFVESFLPDQAQGGTSLTQVSPIPLVTYRVNPK